MRLLCELLEDRNRSPLALFARDQPCGTVAAEIVPAPLDEKEHLVLELDEMNQMGTTLKILL